MVGARYCHACKHLQAKAADPERVAYRHLKANVNTRNKRRAAQGRPLIKFALTLAEFREFAVRHDYLLGAGRQSHSYHIDRMCDCDFSPGYCRENIQVLSNADNVRKELVKRHTSRQYDYRTRQASWLRWGWPEAAPLVEEELPF